MSLKRHTELLLNIQLIIVTLQYNTIGSFTPIRESIWGWRDQYYHIGTSKHFYNPCTSHVHVHTSTHRAAEAKFSSQQVTMELSGWFGRLNTLWSLHNEVSLCVCYCHFTTAEQRLAHTHTHTHTRVGHILDASRRLIGRLNSPSQGRGRKVTLMCVSISSAYLHSC